MFDNVLAVIPCREGSQRFPGKNIAMFDGLPLVVRKVRQAQEAGLTNIAVTTNSPGVKDAVKDEPGMIIHRTWDLCTPETSQEDVVADAALRAEKVGVKFDTICVLQVTSPMLPVLRLKDALTKYQNNTCKSIVAVTKAYQPSGGFYIIDKDLFLDNLSFYQEGGSVYILPWDECQDIDFEWQYQIAKCVSKYNIFSDITDMYDMRKVV